MCKILGNSLMLPYAFFFYIKTSGLVGSMFFFSFLFFLFFCSNLIFFLPFCIWLRFLLMTPLSFLSFCQRKSWVEIFLFNSVLSGQLYFFLWPILWSDVKSIDFSSFVYSLPFCFELDSVFLVQRFQLRFPEMLFLRRMNCNNSCNHYKNKSSCHLIYEELKLPCILHFADRVMALQLSAAQKEWE